MGNFNFTAWVDGILIKPQHFELQENAMMELFNQSITRLAPYYWGVDNVEIDTKQLELGIIKIVTLSGRFANGVEFNLTSSSRHSLEIKIDEIIANQNVYLAIANNHLVGESADSGKRYVLDEVMAANTSDKTAPESPILTRRLNLQLIMESQREQYSICYPIFKIKKSDPELGVVLDASYIPPCINVISNSYMYNLLNRSIMLIQRKQNQLASNLGSPLQGRNLTSLSDIALLQLLNKYQIIFKQLLTNNYLHPNHLYQQYQIFLAELGTFYQQQRTAIELPEYQHLNLQHCFMEASKKLTEILQLKFEHQANQLSLKKDKDNIYHYKVIDLDTFKRSELILGIRVADENLRTRLASFTKIASMQELNDIVNMQLSGLQYKRLDLVPPQLPYYDDMLYLRLQRIGKRWDSIIEQENLAISLSGIEKNIEVKLWTIPELELPGGES